MTPAVYRILVRQVPTLLVASDNYRRRVSILYRRELVGAVSPELFIDIKNNVQATVGGNGIFVLPAMQFQLELDKKDLLYAVAYAVSAQLPSGGIEVSVVVEPLQDDAPTETTEPGGEGKGT